MFNHFHHKLLSLFSSAIPISKALVFLSISSLVIVLFRTKMKSGGRGESTTIDIEARSASKGKGPVVAVHHVKEEKGGMERGMAIIDLVLRIGAIVSALAAAATMGTSDQNLPFFTQFFQFEASYDDMPSFQFFLIAMSLVAGYLVLSLPFSVVCIVRPHASGPRLLLLILDLVALTLATSAAGAATSIVYLAHNGNSSSNWLAICNQFGDFCKNVSGAVVASFVTVVTFMFLILLSALALRKHH